MHHLHAHSMALGALVLLALAGTAPARAEELGESRTFRDWIVACDNTRTCRAFGLPKQDTTTGLALRIDRAGDAEAKPVVSIVLDRDTGGMTGLQLWISFDEAQPSAIVPGQSAAQDEETVTVTDSALAGRLLADIGRGRSLRVTLGTGNGPLVRPDAAQPDAISLDGAMAALIWMDEQQGRIGTRGAIARPGNGRPRPPLRTEPPRAAAERRLPDQRDVARRLEAVRAPVLAAFRALPTDTCEDEDNPAIAAHRLAARLLLVAVQCWRGAYQSSDIHFLVREGPAPQVRPASFPRPRKPSPDARPEPLDDAILTTSDVDAATGRVAHFAKGRGIGDCGEIAEWQWDGERFQPVRFDVMPTCRGLSPPNWFSLYRTR